MRKILGDGFAKKCRELLKAPHANMLTVARKLECSPSTVYRATGGKKRAAVTAVKWVEETRKARTKTGRKNSVGATKATRSKARKGTGVRGLPKNRDKQQAGNRERAAVAKLAADKAKRIAAKRAAMNAA